MKMQAGGQYGLADVQQFNVHTLGASASHIQMIALGNGMSLSSSLPKSQSDHAQHLNHLVQQPPAHQHQQPPPESQHHSQAPLQATQEGKKQSNPQQELHREKNQQDNYLQQPMQLGLLPDSADAPTALATRHPKSSLTEMITSGEHLADDDEAFEDGERVGAGSRWPRQETLALIKIRSEMDRSFRDCALKSPLWEEVSRRLSEQGYQQRNGKKCKEKFENIYKYYKKTKEGRAGRQDGKNYRFFAELDALYGSGNSTRAGDARGENGIRTFKGEVGGGSLLKLKEPGANDRVAEGVAPAQRPLETAFDVNFSSETSEEEEDEPGDMGYRDSRKRKRVWNTRMLRFEKLLKRLFQKQEELQRNFFDVLERREKDRFIREEAWMRQETARLNREYELRSQEHALALSQNATLVAHMQRITGKNLQFPDGAPPVSSSFPQKMQEEDQEKDQSDPGNKRWPKPEVQALIRLRSTMEPNFQDAGPKGSLWEDVAAGMNRLGYNRNAKRCKEKWENINKYFRKSKDSSKKRPQNAKTCQYFNELDDLYRKRILSPSTKSIKPVDPPDQIPAKADVGSNEDTIQTDRGEVNVEATAMPIAGAIPEDDIPSNCDKVHALSSAPENGESNGNREEARGNDDLSLTADASKSISASSLSLAFDSLHGNETFSSITNKSLKLEGLVKEMLEMHNLSEFEGRNEQQNMMNHATTGDGSSSR
ncbi:hypothetical protein O6H91_03G103200 [Diphasiastrum complanatum]|uniref:Uncharacterized protein n=1 Tax=Diphasiastrum complanatum TaxID=34168 RepID=A0ACC2EA54_DIPCM|nr:hypothetical protein O6H91_03G103200 [Diphasiastrum complanatum]